MSSIGFSLSCVRSWSKAGWPSSQLPLAALSTFPSETRLGVPGQSARWDHGNGSNSQLLDAPSPRMDDAGHCRRQSLFRRSTKFVRKRRTGLQRFRGRWFEHPLQRGEAWHSHTYVPAVLRVWGRWPRKTELVKKTYVRSCSVICMCSVDLYMKCDS